VEEWVVWEEWAAWECNRSNPKQNSKRAVFTALFLCLN